MSILEIFPMRSLIVAGDVILDRYWWGESTRLSPEAPVPVVRKQRTTVRAGGAANTAANLVSLGAGVTLLGVIGADAEARELRMVLEQSGIQSLLVESLLVEDPARPTTSKTRIVAGHQQVVRVDEEDTAPLPESLAERVMKSFRATLPTVQAVVLSDYAKGFLTPFLVVRMIEAARVANVPVFIDPKGADYKHYAGCTLLKPNRLELGILVQRPVRNHEETLIAGRALRSLLPGTSILVTEGADGMTLFATDGSEEHAGSVRQQVFDVTGAGDTVLAVVAISLCSGASHSEALDLASRAAGIVVGIVGTATVSRDQLRG